MRRAGIEAELVGANGTTVTGGHEITVHTDRALDDGPLEHDMIVLPGGQPGATHLRDDDWVIAAVRQAYDEGRHVAAICAAPIVLGRAGVHSA